MKLATSRYSNPGVVTSGLTPVGFTAGHPRFPLRYVLAARLAALGPERSKMNLPKPEFEQAYRARLDDLGLEKITTMLAELQRPDDEGVVLLCYEDLRLPDLWCHRTMFALWWLEQTGEEVQELLDTSNGKKAPAGKAPAVTAGQLEMIG